MNHFNTEPEYASNPRLSCLSGTSTGSLTKSSFQIDEMPYRYQVEFEKLVMEKKQFESTHGQLLTEYDELRERFVNRIMMIVVI
jgi:hypothetical protein